MNVNYLNPFIEASRSVMNNLAGLQLNLGKVFLRGNSFIGDNVIIIIGLTGVLTGNIIINFDTPTIDILFRTMYVGDPEILDNELKKSAMAELANMIVGNATSIFYKRGIKIFITPPSIITGKRVIISNRNPVICIPLIIGDNQGKFEINISVIETQNSSSEEKI